MPFPNPLKLTKPRLILASVVVLVLALAGYGLTMKDDPIENCPEGETCLVLHTWPPFTAVYRQPSTYGVTYGGEHYNPIETIRLEWNSPWDWHKVVLDAEKLDLGSHVHDTTGSWEQQDGRTYTWYDSISGRTIVETLEEYEMVDPDVFNPIVFSGFELTTRTDGVVIQTSADVCTGQDCHEVGAQGTAVSTMGRRFDDTGISHVTLTDDKWRIPLAGGDLTVLELQIRPTASDADACHTNLRTVFRQDGALEQQWAEDCESVHRTGANAHYYTFTLDEPQMINLRAESPTDDLYLFLLQGAGKSGQVLDQNDNLGASGSTDGPLVSGITRRLEAGTYTIEVTTNALAHSSGSFDVSLQGEPPAPTAIPTPTLTP